MSTASKYKGDAIRKMTALFQPFSTAAYNWLIEKNMRELVEAAEFLKSGSEKSLKWLIDNKHFSIAAFANAVKGDKNAFKWLMQHNEIFLAATANAVNKDREAMAWLKQYKLDAYAELAAAIMAFEKLDNSDFSGYYKPPSS